MSTKNPHIDDEPPSPQPAGFWIPRMLVAGLCVGLAAAAYIIFGPGAA
jgi:hypothetical protein